MVNIEEDKFGGALNEAPNEKWKKFFETFKDIDSLEVSKWKPSHVLGYFCKKYYNFYNIKYQFKFNSPSPSKSFEIFQIKRLSMLLSSDPKILKGYIDWVYKEKVEKSKRRLTSISFMTHEDLVNNYKINVLLSNNLYSSVDRSTKLPDDYTEIVKPLESIVPIVTYGDLAFLNQSFKSGCFDTDLSLKFTDIILKLQNLGFDLNILDKIV